MEFFYLSYSVIYSENLFQWLIFCDKCNSLNCEGLKLHEHWIQSLYTESGSKDFTNRISHDFLFSYILPKMQMITKLKLLLPIRMPHSFHMLLSFTMILHDVLLAHLPPFLSPLNVMVLPMLRYKMTSLLTTSSCLERHLISV